MPGLKLFLPLFLPDVMSLPYVGTSICDSLVLDPSINVQF